MHKTKRYRNAGATVNGLMLAGLLLIFMAVPAQAVVGLATDGAASEVSILHRQSQILQTPWKVVRVAVTDPAIADIKVLTADQVLIQGLKIGTTDILLWSEDETQVLQKKVNVVLDVEKIRATLGDLFPQSSLQLSESGENLIIRGSHRSADKAAQLQEFLDKKNIQFIDMTDVAGVQQVQLQVRIAEVTKTGLRKLGVDWVQAGTDFQSGIRPGGALADSYTIAPDSIMDYEVGSSVTAFGVVTRADLAFFLEALAENQYLRLLANPTLVALNGEEAGFLAGGEFPVPVVQSSGTGGGGGSAISIEYREYGVRLTFKPVVLGDGTIRLYASPEVSELDYVNGTTVNGTSVPGVLSRKAQTTVELKSGQSFAMAGLLSDSATSTNSSIPGLGDLPVLGPLFRSVRYQQKETELVILVTANLVEPMNIDPNKAPLPGLLHKAPNDWKLYIDGDIEVQDLSKLDMIDAEWLRKLGLDNLNGPGAWDEYGDQAPASQADMNPDTI
ncbi:MAG: type II and III secretion system protein family protein [Phycisphaerae bacterium]|nr:type II and III secretion system protein family protein [Phycisphaerae bacterium]